MAQSIEKFIINPDLRTSTGEQAREKAFNEFTINNMAYQYADCLQLLS
jgi:hypothetical protein